MDLAHLLDHDQERQAPDRISLQGLGQDPLNTTDLHLCLHLDHRDVNSLHSDPSPDHVDNISLHLCLNPDRVDMNSLRSGLSLDHMDNPSLLSDRRHLVMDHKNLPLNLDSRDLNLDQ